MKKIDYIVLSMVEPPDKNTVWAYPIGNGLVSLRVFNNGEWMSADQTIDLTPYLKKIDAQTLYLSKSDAQNTYATKDSLSSHISDDSNPHKVTKDQVGLGNVDNTSDADKPVSTAVQEALNLKQDKTDNALDTENKTVVGAINEILPKATGVGKIDPNSNGTGEIFNSYEGAGANEASEEYSHAEGWSTNATGNYSHAENYNTTASGWASHAEGRRTKATGEDSHAEGRNTIASGDFSHAEGIGTEALTANEHAEGRYNRSYDAGSINVRIVHSVGIGGSDTDRKNAHEIKVNGDHYIYGLGNFDGTNPASAQTLQEVVNSKQATITAGTGLEFEGNTLNVTLDTTVFKVVSALPDSPAQGDENKIHLVPAESTGANNAYTEYIWVNSAWEILGEYTSEVDLTPYLKITDAQSTYATKTELTAHTGNTSNPHNVTKVQVGLGNVDNTSDANKPVSTAQQAAINEVNDKTPVYTTVPTLAADYTIPVNATTREYIYEISIGATKYNVTAAEGIKWIDNNLPLVEANSKLIVSVVNNIAVWGTVYE